MSRITNIAAYQFATLTDLAPLRERLRTFCETSRLKGTIILSTEGVNLFMAGDDQAVDELLKLLRAMPGLEKLTAKYSYSDVQPFAKLMVKIKKEIIPFGVEGIDPVGNPAPKISARELKSWLDEGRPVTLLDTRNNFEVQAGTFNHAVPMNIDHFRDFPAAVQQLPNDWKAKPIIMFCTGGIRCEKAGPYMLQQGFQQIYQLDGGILKYFEECGEAHYHGECFVFDERVGVDTGLKQTHQIITDDQVIHRDLEAIARHQAALKQFTTPLPGSIPADNYRPFNVAQTHDGLPMLDFLCAMLGHVPRLEWQVKCERGHIVDTYRHPVMASHVVHAGERYFHLQPANVEPEVNADIRIIDEDQALIVINKPAPLPVHPSGRFNRNTLLSILRKVYAPEQPRPAHRLDANTTGIVVFTRATEIAAIVQQEFASGTIDKKYLARVQGHPTEDQFVCTAPIANTASTHGSRIIDENGLPSRTEFRVRERLADGTTLLEVIPRTGRTNQIRVHLWHLGFPILGEQMYLPNQQLGDRQTGQLHDQPLHLHAWHLTFTHPISKRRVTYVAEMPVGFLEPQSS